MKIEWRCEPLGLGWADICVTFGKRAARWTVPTDLTAQERELVLKSMCEYAHAVPRAVVRNVVDSTVVFPGPPITELTELEWDILYPQGLFRLDEKPRDKTRWAIIHNDVRDKQLKFKPPVGKGPRGRWG